MNQFLNILKYAKPYKKYALGHIISNILFALFSTLSMIALKPMLDVIFKKNADNLGNKIVHIDPVKPNYQGLSKLGDYLENLLTYQMHEFTGGDNSKALIFVVGLIIVAFLLKNLFGYLANYFMVFLRNGVVRDLRNAVYKKTVDLPLSYFSEQKKGDIMARVTNDVSTLQYSMLPVLELIIREPLTIIFTIVAMVYLSPSLTLFVFIFIPITGLIISRIGKSLKRKSDRVQVEQGVILSTLEETLSGLRIIKGFNAEKKFEDKFKDSSNRFYNFSNKLMNRQNLASPASEVLGIFVIAVLLWYGGQLVLKEGSTGGLDGSSFLVYMGLAYYILTPAKAISRGLYNIKQGDAAAERIQEIIDTPNPLKDKENAIVKTGFDSEIVFNNISFKYENEYVLKDFSLTIPKGKTVALVGQSGSGKSTIANLITRFYDVNNGSILIDGIDIREFSTKSLRQQLGIVTQDAILFNDSIKNNLKLGNDNATNDDVIEALKIANAWEFVKDLPNGIETNIGDSGNKLSGGQKQRLSIARAVLKSPPIMVLDEATSALDTESERLVQIALENMMKNRTSIVIAHRLSTIQNADDIVVLNKGEIVEQGKHYELIAKNGIYKKLVDMQSFD
ncbi:MAG: ABC transporter ATP-binding protein [Flavobacteriales bacterium]|nr:ABC transporter ATP-binding protein [Flavobacteriia bacterium]NCP06643.1 ABC transporter ATP-binding protein [Flavobacteriales bacterium]PIV94841.1 MAG: antibiotic ABC transporter ATP-binding protein [Flavobacteriaceae bacterium CG17_big_fil_post_rev_8_21_14_2_50_33_15]PIY11516.1 MAG: antibiotic ABC transporter ATP-binding protein [Flavobacteriaceae bacterium CG_4_10_14_3_um_filter_33_47]PJB17065.1 MAG: antibiotic ABC transporter ATP-binding protein [Flavobacteriaceae bacterium CG_4_9_14_3_u